MQEMFLHQFVSLVVPSKRNWDGLKNDMFYRGTGRRCPVSMIREVVL